MVSFSRWIWLCSLTLQAACGFPLAPVSEQGIGLRHPETEYREVLPGDTLYSISWESGRDYRDVAKWNNVSPPYVIKPGQKLRLHPPAGGEQARQPVQKPLPTSTQRAATTETLPGDKKPASGKSSTDPTRRSSVGTVKSLSWVWPVEGTLVERYTANGPNKGIGIAGKRGQPILAAEAGQVVYQGGGLRGYGQLIIVKHNADFLSAYAHCDKIYVKEGNVIKRGQKIADMGSSGADRVMLHFEIRIRGAPVDPQDYLPRK